MARAVILGGTGAIGWATARRLLSEGWQVLVTGRDVSHVPPRLKALGAQFELADRDDARAVPALLGGGADLLVDCTCYTAAHATKVIPWLGHVTSAVMISGKAVYVDDMGRHVNSEAPPHFAVPIRENQPTLRPNGADFNSREGYGPNKVAAEEVLLDSGLPVTVLRPSKVHGACARVPREWVFLKRVIDRRPVVFLAREGRGADHPSAALNIAALISLVAKKPGRRIMNIADPDCPNGRSIARCVAAHFGHSWKEVLLDENDHGALGAHPWDFWPPIVLDTTAATDLGYQPVGTYEATIPDELDWIAPRGRTDQALNLPQVLGSHYFQSFFDYAAEGRYLAEHGWQ